MDFIIKLNFYFTYENMKVIFVLCTAVQKLVVSVFFFLKKSILLGFRLHLFDDKYSTNSKKCEILLQYKIAVFCVKYYTVKFNLSLWSKLNFHQSSLQCHMIFRNHSNMLICCSRNISGYYHCWKLLHIFVKSMIHFIFQDFKNSKQQHLFEKEVFCNFINVCTVTFDQFSAFLLNKCIHFLILLTSNFWTIV